jgi:chemotaxis protein CheX
MPVTEEAFYGIIEETWTSTLGFQVDRAESDEITGTDALTVCVKITGAWDGELRLDCAIPLARSIASTIFQVEAENPGSDDILDALSELTHIIGGNLKTLLPQPVTLSLPSVPEQTHCLEAAPAWQTIYRLTLTSEGHPFVVALLGEFPPAEQAAMPAINERRVPAAHT